MVEQSVISLDDEDDETLVNSASDPAGGYGHQTNGRAAGGSREEHDDEDDDDGQLGGYYDRVGSSQPASDGADQQQQLAINAASQQSDDQHSNYSSGIYRRKHINERAFSYSIRQEHKSNGGEPNSDADNYNMPEGNEAHYSGPSYQQQQGYRSARLGNDPNNNKRAVNYQQQQQQLGTYDSPHQAQGNIYHNTRSQLQPHRQPLQYATGAGGSSHHQSAARVDELSARLESQLGMKSFTSSGVKSHM